MRSFAAALLAVVSGLLSASPAERIQPPAIVERTLAVKETQTFEIRLDKGWYVEASVRAPKTLVDVALVDPAGHDIATSPARVLAIAEMAGFYTVRLQCPASAVVGGAYVLNALTSQNANERQKNLDRASRLRMQGEAEKKTSKDAAQKSFREALALFEAAGDGTGTREALRSLAMLAYRSTDLPGARQWFGRELQSAISDGDALSQARAAFWLGYTYLDSDPRKARGYFEESANAAKQLGNEPLVANALNAAAAEYMPGNIDRGLAVLKEAREIAERLHDTWMLAYIRTTEGNAFTFRGEFRQALEAYEAALPLYRQAGNPSGEANTLSNIGEALTNVGEYKRALQTFDDAIAVWKKIGNRGREMYAVHNRARVYAAQGQRELARREFDTVIRTAHELGVGEAEGAAWNEMGETWVTEHQPKQAIECFEHAISAVQPGVSARVRGHAFLLRSRAEHELGRDDDAVNDAGEALKLFTEISDRNNELLAREAIARAEFTRGDAEAARQEMSAAMDLVETGRAELQRRMLQGSYVATRSNLTELYIQSLVATGRTADAFGAAERFRARNLRDALGDSSNDLFAAADPKWAADDRQLREQLRHDAAALVHVPAGERSAVQRRIDNTLAELDRLAAQVRQTGGRALRMAAGETISAAEVRKYLDSDTAVVEFLLAEPHSYAWVADRSGLRLVTLASRQKIERAAQRVRRSVAEFSAEKPGEPVEERARRRDAALKNAEETTRALDALTIAALRISANKHRLAIVPDGALWYTPWSMLAGTQGREVAIAPSVTTVARIRQTQGREPSRDIAVLADPVYGREDPRFNGRQSGTMVRATLRRATEAQAQSRFARLRFSQEEALAIADVAPKGRVLRALGFDASRELAVSPELKNYRAVHFAAHTILDNEHPELSGIVLSLFDRNGRPRDGFLRLFDIYAMRLNADLVVLSGCDTAAGKELRGEGLVGLTQGFLAAGADHVVATLWPVEDRATAEFMKRFYRYLLVNRMRPAAALSAARSAMRAETAWSAPYYWAGFQLIGDWR